MWREKVAFDNKFITKISLKLHLSLPWFKLCSISPKKRQFILVDTYSSWKDTFKPPSWKAIWNWVRVWKHLPWIFHLVDLFVNNNTISLFLFSWLSCDFHQNNAKKQGVDIFSTGHPPCYFIIAISLLSWLVLVIGFNNNSINRVSFSMYLCDFHQQMANNKGLQFSAQGTHHRKLLKNFSEQLLQILKK